MSALHNRWVRLLTVCLGLVLVATALSRYRPFDHARPAPPPPPQEGAGDPPVDLQALPGKRQTFLVMGIEGWEGEYGRSDSMLLISFSPKEQRLAMLSIPRDLLVQISGYGYDKINHAYNYGGPDLAVDTVERLLGIEIDHWASFSFDGFMQVIDALGGVEIDAPKRLYFVDPDDHRFGAEGFVIDIQPGKQVMNGLTALQYARFRADAEGDIGRMRRQQEVIQAAIRKGASPAIIKGAPRLIPAVYSTLGTDLTVGEILSLAKAGRAALAKPLQTGTIQGEELWLGGTFYFGTDLIAARRTAYALLVGEPPGEEFLARAQREDERYQTYVAGQIAHFEAMARKAGEEGGPESGPESGPEAESGPGSGTGSGTGSEEIPEDGLVTQEEEQGKEGGKGEESGKAKEDEEEEAPAAGDSEIGLGKP